MDETDVYPDVPSVDYAAIRDSMDEFAEKSSMVLEGVGRGFLKMVVPLVSIGVAIALSKILLKAPARLMVGDL